ncbi:hypothetical protein C0Z16_28595 [Paraburkholderia rhynchosiae]|uniref:Uncharacterized protein n=1 Tax=Paraburkholderia rhynchosiae TaxID=487049 RepID=A0ABX4V0Q4_9BURK|nr:hypothetical protein C0Z16_28595 [Paraburkholderia rhynchosiae]
MSSACAIPTHPSWRGVSQAKIKFSKARVKFAALQQVRLKGVAWFAGLGFAGCCVLRGDVRTVGAAAI